MSIAKKSIKWLVAAIIVFALALTAVFAVGNVASASADTPSGEAFETARVIVVASSDTGDHFPTLLTSSEGYTITANYYVEFPNEEGTEPELAFSPVLILPNNTALRPTSITINPAFNGVIDATQAPTPTQYIEGNGTPAHFALTIAEGHTPAELNGFSETTEGSKVYDLNNYLFSATYTIAGPTDTGVYTFDFGATTQYSLEPGTVYTPSVYFDAEDEYYTDPEDSTTLIRDAAWGRFLILSPVEIPTATNYVYDGAEHSGVATSNNYTILEDETSVNTATVVGNYTAKVQLTDPLTCWTDGTTEVKSIPWSIAKAQVAVPVLDTAASAFTGTDNDVPYWTFDGSAHEIYWQGTLDANVLSYVKVAGSAAATVTDAGNYTATISLVDTDNYEWTTGDTDPKSYAYAIKKLAVSVPTIELAVREYTGSAQNYAADAQWYSFSATGTTVGLYDATVSLTDPVNTYWAGTAESNQNITAEDVLQITVKLIDKPAADATVYTYTGSAQTYSIPASDWYTVSGNTKTDAGNYTVTVALNYGENNVHEGQIAWRDTTTTPVEYSFVINPKPVTLSFDEESYSSVYGEDLAEVTVTADGLVNDGDLGTLGYAVTQNNAAATLENIGTYTLTTTFTANNSNYTVTPDTATYTINPITVTVPVSAGETYVYNRSPQTFAFTQESIVDSQYYEVANDVKTDAGEYTVTATLKNPNYIWADNTTAAKEYTFKINVAVLTVPVPTFSQVTYDGTEKTFTFTHDSLIHSDYYEITGTATGTNASDTPNTVTVTKLGGASTVWADEDPNESKVYNWYITKAQVNVAFHNATYTSVYGASIVIPSLDITGDPIAAGDADALDIHFEGVPSEGAAVGDYPLSIAYTANDNYNVTVGANATYTITAKQVTLSFDEESYTSVYGEDIVEVTVTADGLVNDGDLGTLGYTATQNNEAATLANVGTYILTTTYAANSNYIVTPDTATYEITKKQIAKPAEDTTHFIYNGQPQTYAVAASDWYTVSGNTQTAAGNYTVTIALNDKANTEWATEQGVEDLEYAFVIEQASITVTFTYTYGGSQTVIAENVVIDNIIDTPIRALPSFRYFKTLGWQVNGEGDVVTAYTLDMNGKTLNAAIFYAVGAGDANGDGVITTADVIQLRRSYAGMDKANELANEAAAWAAKDDTTTPYVLASAFDVNVSGAFYTNDIVAVREALATGYSYRVLIENTVQAVKYVERRTAYTYEELVAYVTAGYPVLLGNDIDAATQDFDLDLAIPADIELGDHVLTVNTFSLNNDNAGATIAVAGGTIYTVEGITLTAPQGNVKVSNVNGYTYEGASVILAAYTSSLHIESNVGFYQYKVENVATAADYKATVNNDEAINAISKGEQGIIAITEAKVALMTEKKAAYEQNEVAKAAKQAEVDATDSQDENYQTLVEELNDLIDTGNGLSAAIEEIPVFKAPVSVPVDTHVVVEAAANLEVEQITVIAPKNDTTASTFSVNVKNDQAAVIKVDISEVKEVVEEVNVYHVEEVALEGDISKVEIVKAEDQEIAQTTGVKSEAELNAALASDASVIEIAANFALASWVDITRTVTINGNGYTITANGAIARSNRNYGLHILLEQDVNAVVTINDLNMVTTGRQAAILPNCDYDSTINLNNVNITTDGEAVYPNGKAHVYANNCTFTHNGKYATGKDEVYYSALTVGYAGSITAENCTIVSSDIGVSTFPSGGSITLINTDITITGNDGYAIYAWNGNYDNLAGYNTDSTVSVQSGDIRGALYLKNTNDHHGTNDFDPYIIVTGGTFDHDPTAYVADGYEAVEEDGIWTVEVASVARIGSVGYATLVDAVAAVNASENGGTITLLADLDFSDEVYAGYKWAGSTYNPLVITQSNVTIDLNDHTISNMGNNAIVAGNILAKDGRISNFTIKNGTLLAGKTDNVTNSYVFDVAGVDGALIKNITTVGGINAYTGSKNVVIEDCSIQGTKYYTVCAQTGSDVIIRGTTYTKNTEITQVQTTAMFWVDKVGTDSDCITSENPTGAYGASSLTIESGNFIVEPTGTFYLSGYLKPVVKGGTYNVDPTACLANGYVATEDNGIWTVDKAYVARIGETKYETFDDAVDDAQNGDTIVLLDNVTFGTDRVVPVWEMKAFDIDLNGKTFTTDSNQSITQSNNGYKASAICFGDNTQTSPARNIRIYNGTIRTAYGAGVYIDGAATATLENLTVAQNYPANVQTTDEYSAAVRVTGFGHVIINSGSYSGKNAITISNSGGTVEINGGDFRGNLFISTGGASNAKILTIKGGTFDHDPTAYLAEGYVATEKNGIWTVKAGAARIGSTYYLSLKEALAAAQANDTVVITANNALGVAVATYPAAAQGNVTIDLAGHSVNGGSMGVIKNSSAYELTIVDTVGGGSVNGTGNYTLYNSSTGAITLNSGSITNTTASGTRIAVFNSSTGTFNMNGGSISGGKIAVKNSSTGTVNLYGGTLSGYWVVINADAGTINLDGATITSVSCSDDSGIESQKNGVVNVISGSITARTGIATWNKVSNDAAVNVMGGTITSSHICISTNGNDTYSTQINVSGGTLICEGVAIYNAGIGSVTVSGTASITGGKTGIETRAGVLTVTGGTITSTADTVLVEANGNGTTTTGAGIAVAQHTTKKAITVNITGGTITGVDAILEANPQNNSDADLALISITIGADATLVGDVVITDEAKISYTNNQNA